MPIRSVYGMSLRNFLASKYVVCKVAQTLKYDVKCNVGNQSYICCVLLFRTRLGCVTVVFVFNNKYTGLEVQLICSLYLAYFPISENWSPSLSLSVVCYAHIWLTGGETCLYILAERCSIWLSSCSCRRPLPDSVGQ